MCLGRDIKKERRDRGGERERERENEEAVGYSTTLSF